VSVPLETLRDARATVVLNWASLGGAERRALNLARWLADEHGMRPEVLALTERDGRAVDAARQLGIPWRRIPFEWGTSRAGKARDLARLVRALRAGKADALLPFCSLPNVICGAVWRWSGASTCVWHQSDVSPFTRVSSRLRDRAVRSTPVFVSNAEHAVEHLVHEWGAPRERISVVRTGVDVPSPGSTREEWRGRLGLAREDFVAGMVAHFRRSKDHATLLRAWRAVADELAASGRRAVLLLAGDAYPLGDAAKALAFDLRLEEGVRFLDDVGDVAGLVASCDVAVLSSQREGFPVSVLEAMASGLPIVGTDIPGIREAVGPDGAPFLAPVGDSSALAASILRLARDDELRSRLGEASRQRVRAEFSREQMTTAYAAVLAAAIAKGRRASR
jgi:glycosyltransferase involved in cell wall biosynthesis